MSENLQKAYTVNLSGIKHHIKHIHSDVVVVFFAISEFVCKIIL